MTELDNKITSEKTKYENLRKKYYAIGAIFILLGVVMGIIFSQSYENDPILSSLTITLYIGFGIALAVKSITINQEKERSIREIKTEDKLEKIIQKLESSPIQAQTQTQPNVDITQMPYIIDEWKMVIQTQMHFNDLLMKVRTATLSIVLTIFGAAGYSILSKETFLLTINEITFHPSIIIISSGIVILISMFIIDYRYYYKMLVGSVRRGLEIDEEVKGRFGRKYFGMTTMIGAEIGKKGASKKYVILFYTIPIIAGTIFLLTIFKGFPI